MASELATFEVGFYDPNSGSVSFEERHGGQSPRDVQLVACALFTLRQLLNSGKDAIAQSAAARLGLCPAGDPDELLNLIAELPHPGADPWGRPTFSVTDYKGPAPRRFVGVVEDRPGAPTLKTQLKGFGLLGRALGYYGPASLALFTYHLVSLNRDDEQRGRKLMEVARRCAGAWLDGKANIRNQASVAASVVEAVTQ